MGDRRVCQACGHSLPLAESRLNTATAFSIELNTDINARKDWYSKSDDASEDVGWSGEALVESCLRDFNAQPLAHFWYLGSEADGGFAECVVVPAAHAL